MFGIDLSPKNHINLEAIREKSAILLLINKDNLKAWQSKLNLGKKTQFGCLLPAQKMTRVSGGRKLILFLVQTGDKD